MRQPLIVRRSAIRLVLSLVALLLVGAGCTGNASLEAGTPSDRPTIETVLEEPSVPVVDLFEEPVADDPDPARRAGAASNFIDCEHGIRDGGWSMDFGPPGSAGDPEGALVAFVGDGLFALPRSGFVDAGRDESRRLFTYSVDGKVKTAVIVADSAEVPLDAESGWVVETFASCDPAEFDPSADDQLGFEIWLDAEGRRVPIGTVRSSQGPEHCGWESATFLSLDGNQYIRDPDGVLQDVTRLSEFDGDTDLPSDAFDTGYELGPRHLWLAADRTTAYLVGPDRVEAWPSPGRPFGCG